MSWVTVSAKDTITVWVKERIDGDAPGDFDIGTGVFVKNSASLLKASITMSAPGQRLSSIQALLFFDVRKIDFPSKPADSRWVFGVTHSFYR